MCLDITSICDIKYECPHGDDERLCLQKVPDCPQNCVCSFFSVSCNDWTLPEGSKETISFIHIILTDSNATDLSTFLKQFNQTINFDLENNFYVHFCQAVMDLVNPEYIFEINIARNKIKLIKRHCLVKMSALVHLNLSHNEINSLESQSFAGSSKIRFLDLAWNHVVHLSKNVFQRSGGIQTINLTHNSIFGLSVHTFYMSSIYMIITDNYKICCITLSICTAKPEWPMTCTRLLAGTAARVMIWMISLFGLLLNSCSLLTNAHSLRKQNRKNTKENYTKVTTSLAISDLLLCFSIVTVASADEYIANNYVEKEFYWRQNVICFMMSGLNITANLVSVFTIHMLAILRYILVKYPFAAATMESRLISFSIICAFLVCSTLSCGLMLIYGLTAEKRQMPTGLCLLLGNVDTSAIPLLVTIIMISTHAISVVSIPAIYFCLHVEKAKSKTAIGNLVSPEEKTDKVTRSLSVSLTPLLGWLPSSVLLMLTLFWKEYPYKLFTWATILVFPVNPILNPFVFSSSKAFKNVCRRKK